MIEPLAAKDPTPGSLLRHQRQHIGWTVEEIANALCLSPELIRALESDDYADMGGSTFILGYLRGYARLVSIDVEDAIVNHRDAIPEYAPDTGHAPETAGSARARSSRQRRRRLVIAGVVVVVAAIAGYLWWPAGVNNLPRVTDGLTVEVPQDASAPAAFQAPERNDRMQAIDAAAIRKALDSGGELPMNLVLGDIAPGGGSGAEAPAQAAPDDARRHLVLMFDEGSWADVRDAAGQRLLSQIVDGGSSVDLVGEPPFTVFLGNAGGVRVKYLGRIKTYSQTKKGLFARFTVGQQL